jgi:hypothetical protein
MAIIIPAISSPDAFVTPSLKGTVHVPIINVSDSMLPPSIAGVYANKIIAFPNLQGKHITLKYYNDSVSDSITLYYARYKLFKTVDRVDFDARHPNLSGQHLTLRVVHSADEEFLLAYTSMSIFGKIE